MLAIQSPFPQFPDLLGAPLQGGKAYFGVAFDNPLTAPVDVFWDVEGTQTATQPVRTVNGMFARAGTPANVFCTGDFSILLQDALGRQVYYARSANELNNSQALSLRIDAFGGPGGSALFGFLQAGAGAIGRTGQAKLRERVSLEDYGGVADWDGTTGTDNATAIAKAIAALPAAGGVIELGVGRYMTAGFTMTGVKHVHFVGHGSAEASNDFGATELVCSGLILVQAPKCSFERMVVRGAPGHAGDLVQVTRNAFKASDTCFFDAGQDGLRIGADDDASSNANNFHLENCRFDAGRFGCYLSDKIYPALPDANGGTIINCVGQNCGNDGIRYGNARLNTQIGGVWESNAGCGVRMVQGAQFNIIKGGDFEANLGTAQISVEHANAVFNSIDVATLAFSQIADIGQLTMITAWDVTNAGWTQKGIFRHVMSHDGGANDIIAGTATGGAGSYGRLLYGPDPTDDAHAHLMWGSAGLRLGQNVAGVKMGFFGTNPIIKPTVTGSRGGNAALASLLTQLAALGLVIDSST
jgi:hypothetical protein